MAYIERELELYVYNNKEKVDSISDMILLPQTNESMKNIELMIRIFYEYGNDLIEKSYSLFSFLNTLDIILTNFPSLLDVQILIFSITIFSNNVLVS